MCQQTAVFIDGTALYLALRQMSGYLDYSKLAALLTKKFDRGEDSHCRLFMPRSRVGSSIWNFWTSCSSTNEGQIEFLRVIEETIGIGVSAYPPAICSPIPLDAPYVTTGSDNMLKAVMRFNAQIAYAMGRVAETHRIILMTDSFGMLEPLIRCQHVSKSTSSGKIEMNTLVFFKNSLDPRWSTSIQEYGGKLFDFFDLEEHTVDIGLSKRNSLEVARWSSFGPAGV